jgi:nucleoside-diphosphate-sugar epimerase
VTDLHDPPLRAVAALRTALVEIGEPYMLIGGTAVILGGAVRVTDDDVDATVWGERVDLPRPLSPSPRTTRVGAMRLLVTGATGFVGSHAVRLLLDAGHDVRLLARTPAKVTAALPDCHDRLDAVVEGDMAQPDVVRAALASCDGVVHAAASVLAGPGAYETNVAGVRHVVGTAAEMGLDPIVYLSRVSAMFPPRGPALTLDDPLGDPESSYGRSKVAGELVARELQARGAPVAIVYPSGVCGPEDPAFGEGSKGLRDRLRYGWILTSGGMASVDVRDLASIITKAAAPGRGPRRYMAGGHFLTWAEEADLCEMLTARRVRRWRASPRLVRSAGRVVDVLRRLVPGFDYPLTHEAALYVTLQVPCDSRAMQDELGVAFRPVAETLTDAIRWMHAAGHLDARYAGSLAA